MTSSVPTGSFCPCGTNVELFRNRSCPHPGRCHSPVVPHAVRGGLVRARAVQPAERARVGLEGQFRISHRIVRRHGSHHGGLRSHLVIIGRGSRSLSCQREPASPASATSKGHRYESASFSKQSVKFTPKGLTCLPTTPDYLPILRQVVPGNSSSRSVLRTRRRPKTSSDT